jgi:hypothetical protein
VSRSLFISDEIMLQGFPWCSKEPKKIGIGSLVAKIFCEQHNHALSELDTGLRACSLRRILQRRIRHHAYSGVRDLLPHDVRGIHRCHEVDERVLPTFVATALFAWRGLVDFKFGVLLGVSAFVRVC